MNAEANLKQGERPNATPVVRRIHGGPGAETPQYWFDGGAFETHFFNALSTTFPEGERFFILSVRAFAGQVQEPQLQREVEAFVGQEGQHGQEHDAHLAILAEQGYTAFTRWNEFMKAGTRWIARKVPRYALALTTAIEHITAVLAEALMSEPERWLDRMHPDMRLLWHWHAVEETEHKAVAFDVFETTGGGTWMRRVAMTHVLSTMFVEIALRHMYCLHRDGLLFSGREWRRGVRFLWGRGGMMRRIFQGSMAFYRDGFHPWDLDNRDRIDAFEASFGAQYTGPALGDPRRGVINRESWSRP